MNEIMKRYSDYSENAHNKPDFPWVKFKIISETEEDKQELLRAFKHLHDANINTDFIAVNQLVHLYHDHPNDPCSIIVKHAD